MEIENAGKAKGGYARAAKMNPEERSILAKRAATERWRQVRAMKVASASIKDPGGNTPVVDPRDGAVATVSTIINNLPVAQWPGELEVGIACYVLSDGRRVISRTGATDFLTDGKGGGNLESYTGVQSVTEFMPQGMAEQMVEFSMPGVVNKTVKGLDAETFVEICRGYVAAWQAKKIQSEAQVLIAMRAAMFLGACAKVGLIALIDEATGYQYARPSDALALKLKLFLAEEMRKWEKTFPDELWEQFGRLTNWKGPLHSRPKYWGKLVLELIYEYLDPDVAEWLRENAPKPIHGKNYHLWLTEQYGLRKLIEHIWKVIGIASACDDIKQLRNKMEELYGTKSGFQYSLKLIKNSSS